MRGNRSSWTLADGLMAQWMGKVGFARSHWPTTLWNGSNDQVGRTGERVFADETTLPTLAPGSGKTQKAWLWAYARDDRPFGGAGPLMVAYRFDVIHFGCLQKGGDGCPLRHRPLFSCVNARAIGNQLFLIALNAGFELLSE
jgi:hypothetical protein